MGNICNKVRANENNKHYFHLNQRTIWHVFFVNIATIQLTVKTQRIC